MKNFMDCDFDIKDITIACCVAPGMGVPVHKNRASHGLVIQTSANPDTYNFDNGKSVTIEKNDILYLPKGSNYVASSSVYGKNGCYAINFQIRNDEYFEPFKIKPKNILGFAESFKKAEQAWKNKPYNYKMKCKAELYSIIFAMQQEFRLAYIGHNKEQLLRPALKYIHNEYTSQNISIEHLAELCGISSVYLRRLFKHLYGTSPLKYINDLKIERSKELIKSGMYSISEAAYLSGFSDISHFSREFKKSEGIPPIEYSKKIIQ